MAHITLTGTLLTPAGKTAYRDQIRFTHKSTTGETVRSSVDLLTIIASGFYYVELEYGLVLIEYKSANDSQFKNLGVATVNGTNPSTSIPELLNGLVPVSSSELIQFQAILADAVAAKNESVVARNEAEAFANSIDLINDLSQAYEFDTLADVASSSIVFPLGKKINLKETSTGLLDGGLYEVTTVSPLAITELKQGKLVGDGGKKYIVIAGVLRHDGANWGLLLDSGHTSINSSSVSVDGSIDLTINYTKPGSKVVSLLCGPDEGYARLGMICGASVGTSLASIRASLPMSYQIETNGTSAPTITAPSEIINRLIPTRSGFKLRVNHTGAINANPIVIPVDGSVGGYATDVTSTAFNIQQFSNTKYTYKVRYATAWQLATNDPSATLDTTSFASSGNIVVNTSTVDNTDLISVTSRYAQVAAVSKNTTSFTLRFYDFAGTLLQTEANGTMEAYIGYGEERVVANTSTTLPVGKYNVENGRVLVYWDDLTSTTSLGDNANIWFKGVVLE